MAISLSSLRRTSILSPIRAILYGVQGVGKTSTVAGAPNPVFLQTEDGAGSLNLATFGVLKSYGQIMEAIGSLYAEEHDFRTVVLDTLDHAEPHIWTETCSRNGWKTIEDASFGKGYVAADAVWREMLDGFNALRDDKGMSVFLLAHSEVKRFESPVTEAYDRYQIKLHKRASALVQETVDCVFFQNHRVSIVRDKSSGPAKAGDGKARGVGSGVRVIYTEERPAFLAKNRFSMPDSIDLPDDPAGAWPTLAVNIPYFNTNAALAAE